MIKTAKSPALAFDCPECGMGMGSMCIYTRGAGTQRNEVHAARVRIATAALTASVKPADVLRQIEALGIMPTPGQVKDHLRRTAAEPLRTHAGVGWVWKSAGPKRAVAASDSAVWTLRQLALVEVNGNRATLTALGRAVLALVEDAP